PSSPAPAAEASRPAAEASRAEAPSSKVVDINRGARQTPEPAQASDLPVAPAAPSVRRMAREVGVDINKVPGTGPDGRISVDDVKAYAKRIVTEASSAQGAAPRAAEPLP